MFVYLMYHEALLSPDTVEMNKVFNVAGVGRDHLLPQPNQPAIRLD